MRLAICEDQKEDRERLEEVLGAALKLQSVEFQLDCYKSGEALVEKVTAGTQYDLLFLDIYLGKMNGVETARRVLELEPSVEFAFLTESREFAVDAFALNALHYMVKPVQPAQIQELMKRYQVKKRNTDRILALECGRESFHFTVSLISRVISERKGVRIYLANGRNQWVRVSFMTVMEQLGSDLFLLVTRGYLVNMNYIDRMNRESCVLEDGTELLLSRRNRSHLRDQYYDFLFRYGQVSE